MGAVRYHYSLLKKDFFTPVNRSLADLLWVISFFKVIHFFFSHNGLRIGYIDLLALNLFLGVLDNLEDNFGAASLQT